MSIEELKIELLAEAIEGKAKLGVDSIEDDEGFHVVPWIETVGDYFKAVDYLQRPANLPDHQSWFTDKTRAEMEIDRAVSSDCPHELTHVEESMQRVNAAIDEIFSQRLG